MTLSIKILAEDVTIGSRMALAKAITLVESQKPEHRKDAEDLLTKLLPKTGAAMRIAISGPPGVGKSSFIESFGLFLVEKGKKLAVLAIDPSSPVTGGSILGDKTRMEELAKSSQCFIRPSPTSGTIGGVARHTRETILLCEASGFDIILIETVGIGQSEYEAASMTDLFVQLHQPNSGDELQGLKKGVMELADLFVVTKADGDQMTSAELARQELTRAISLTRSFETTAPKILLCSAHEKKGFQEIWSAIETQFLEQRQTGALARKRHSQVIKCLQQEIHQELLNYLHNHPRYIEQLSATEKKLKEGPILCSNAAREFISNLIKRKN